MYFEISWFNTHVQWFIIDLNKWFHLRFSDMMFYELWMRDLSLWQKTIDIWDTQIWKLLYMRGEEPILKRQYYNGIVVLGTPRYLEPQLAKVISCASLVSQATHG